MLSQSSSAKFSCENFVPCVFVVKLFRVKPLTIHTCKLTDEQASALLAALQARNWKPRDVPYARFAFESDKTNIVFYESGKLVVQGKGTAEFVEFVLEPEILKEVKLGYETILNPELLLPRIGVDESGKGDFFGPLSIAGVYVNEKVIAAWKDLGIRDSKNISSDKKIAELAEKIRKTPGCVTDSVVIGNEAYNRLYAKMKSVNTLLAWGHARVIENLLGKRYQMNPPPVKAISDQFAASKSVIEKALMAQGKELPARAAAQGGRRHRRGGGLDPGARRICERPGETGKTIWNETAERRVSGGGCGGEKICGRTRRGRTGENFQAAFPHGAARARFAGAAEDGVAENDEKLLFLQLSPYHPALCFEQYVLPTEGRRVSRSITPA